MPNDLSTTVRNCLPQLQALSLTLETYGSADDAATLRDVVEQLRSASPTGTPLADNDPMEFVVSGTFKVTRRQVANALWHAFTGEITWLRITETVPPRNLRFRSIDQTSPGIVDYPLNEGGAVRIATSGPRAEEFELRLDVINEGLEALARHCPRHFADLVGENADAITADALLQCCLFGELIYG